jgi:regulator of protease activity HflC (stomatin/prohibitin superfamily)
MELTDSQIVSIVAAVLVIFTISRGLRVVPQAQKWVVERFGRFQRVLGPGINLIVPFVDSVAHKVEILERQLPNASQDAITSDNVLVVLETSVFYRILYPERTVYRIRDVDNAISTTVAGIVRSEVGRIELDQVQSNRGMLIDRIKAEIEEAVEQWGIEVTRAEILDVNLDEATREAMLQQLNAERARRAEVTRAEGEKRAIELRADAALYETQKAAEARRVEADAEAYATQVVAAALADNGTTAAQYQVALKQVEAINALAQSPTKSTIVLPAQALDAFADAFKLFKGVK